MIKVTVEIIPLGLLEVKDKWVMHIWNTGTGTKSIGNYFFKIFRKNTKKEEVWKGGEVNGFHRLRHSVFYLLYLCLKKVYGE